MSSTNFLKSFSLVESVFSQVYGKQIQINKKIFKSNYKLSYFINIYKTSLLFGLFIITQS